MFRPEAKWSEEGAEDTHGQTVLNAFEPLHGHFTWDERRRAEVVAEETEEELPSILIGMPSVTCVKSWISR